jgi:hypothetical protein
MVKTMIKISVLFVFKGFPYGATYNFQTAAVQHVKNCKPTKPQFVVKVVRVIG